MDIMQILQVIAAVALVVCAIITKVKPELYLKESERTNPDALKKAGQAAIFWLVVAVIDVVVLVISLRS